MATSFDGCGEPFSFNIQGERMSGECRLRRSEPPPDSYHQSAEAMRSVWAIGPTSCTRTMAALA